MSKYASFSDFLSGVRILNAAGDSVSPDTLTPDEVGSDELDLAEKALVDAEADLAVNLEAVTMNNDAIKAMEDVQKAAIARAKAVVAVRELREGKMRKVFQLASVDEAQKGVNNIQTGPRGGRYYLSSSGEKIYVDKNDQPIGGSDPKAGTTSASAESGKKTSDENPTQQTKRENPTWVHHLWEQEKVHKYSKEAELRRLKSSKTPVDPKKVEALQTEIAKHDKEIKNLWSRYEIALEAEKHAKPDPDSQAAMWWLMGRRGVAVAPGASGTKKSLGRRVFQFTEEALKGPKNIQTGPRGGRYYVADNGEHVYVDEQGNPVAGGSVGQGKAPEWTDDGEGHFTIKPGEKSAVVFYRVDVTGEQTHPTRESDNYIRDSKIKAGTEKYEISYLTRGGTNHRRNHYIPDKRVKQTFATAEEAKAFVMMRIRKEQQAQRDAESHARQQTTREALDARDPRLPPVGTKFKAPNIEGEIEATEGGFKWNGKEYTSIQAMSMSMFGKPSPLSSFGVGKPEPEDKESDEQTGRERNLRSRVTAKSLASNSSQVSLLRRLVDRIIG